eukprot:373823-Rhodomonas_salina.1
MQALVDEVKRFSDWSGMWANVSKSKITAINYATGFEPQTGHILYGDNLRFTYLGSDESYKYLGFHVSLTLNWTDHKLA